MLQRKAKTIEKNEVPPEALVRRNLRYTLVILMVQQWYNPCCEH